MNVEISKAVLFQNDLDWLTRVIDWRLGAYFADNTNASAIPMPEPTAPSFTGSLLGEDQNSWPERLVLALVLAPHLAPHRLDPLLIQNATLGRKFTEFGGQTNRDGAFWPTVETASFLLSGDDLEARLRVMRLFSADGVLRRRCLVDFEEDPKRMSLGETPLRLGSETSRVVLGHHALELADFSGMPARKLSTPFKWDDLVLSDPVNEGVQEVLSWIKHHSVLLKEWGLEDRVAPGFKCLFYGPPGTGKSLTSALLGKATGLDVYRVDLSLVVSKWIGETEKNLARLFDEAERFGWLLFFDEADALFGKRSRTRSANDRYANQEVAYLLQRLEEFTGVAILASNLRGNIDDAFVRRFQSIVYFAPPGPQERLALWKRALAPPLPVSNEIDIDALASEYDVTGGNIVNIVRRSAISAVGKGGREITVEHLQNALTIELQREGRLG
ncbi:MAG: ATP-binding protein [Paracoccaceae bacterium]|nr:ATP-binding protein [Paracoccaceae bacterium]